MLRDGREVSIDVVPFDSTQRTYVIKDGVTYKIDDSTSVIYGGVDGIMKGYRVFFGVDGVQIELNEGDSLTIKDNKYFDGVETVTTVYTTQTNDIDVTYNAIDIQRMNALHGSGFVKINQSDISVSGMTVTIQPQEACIDGIKVTAKESVQIPIDTGLSQLRTDLIVLRKTQTTASADYFVKKGELGSTTPPELEQVEMGIYEVPICSIRVNANQTTLELSNIIDLRNYMYNKRGQIPYDDGKTIKPVMADFFVLSLEQATRTVLDGMYDGQEIRVYNSTSITITCSGIAIPSNDVYLLTWKKNTWSTDSSTSIPSPNKIAQYDGTSNLSSSVPTQDIHVARKKEVDDAVELLRGETTEKTDTVQDNLTSHINNQDSAHGSTTTPTSGKIAKYDTDKRLNTADGVSDTDCANMNNLESINSTINTHIDNQLDAHGATPTPTAGKIAEFDGNKRMNSTAGGTTATNVIVYGDTANTATANKIARYDEGGRLSSNTPSATTDVARKAETDAVQSNLTSHMNNQSSAHGSTPTPTAGKIAEYDNELQLNSRGAIVTGTAGSVITVPDLSTTPVANRVPRYDSSSRLETATPVSGNDCANKTYVDDKIDGVITDASTLSPTSSGAVRLTLSASTRLLSDGVFAGQEFTIINSTSATKTINATTRGGSFQLTSTRTYTKLVWSGTTWLRGMEIPIGTTVWLLTNDNPDTMFGGDWNMVGTKDRALVSGNGTTGNSTGKLPQINGTVQLVSDYQNNAATRTPTGAFGTPVATSKITSSTSQRTLKDTFGLDFSANRSNSTKYSTSKTELIKADGTYVNGWTKVAF